MAYVTGQRYISEAEPELGLGQVLETTPRTVLLGFPATATTRQYAIANAPLTRLRYLPGDYVEDTAGKRWKVLRVSEINELLHYQVAGLAEPLPETGLSAHLGLSEPLKRLEAGQFDAPGWFLLRRQALQALGFIESTPLLGLCSGRTELLPHQLHIAYQTAIRPAPRVLLCDEVGLGKTIEACLILQQQLFSGLASRILVLVPETLVHQWLIELLRRFNLRFTILDEERCQALTELNPANPFESEQLVLCSTALLRDDHWRSAATAAGWDLLVVDEAHHLACAGSADEQQDYVNLQQLAEHIPGLLLLTATPDQAGLQNHFALLQLLDPQRFHDFGAFASEQERYASLAALLDPLAELPALATEDRHRLLSALKELATDDGLRALLQSCHDTVGHDQLQNLARDLLEALLDRHGTGRVVFRNTRRTISGFPPRRLHACPLPLPELYRGCAGELYPEQQFLHDDVWLKEDPRIRWLLALLQERRNDKFLLICSNRATASTLEAYLRLHRGIRSTVFHEGMTLLERDRSAAWFADPDEGAQLLVCSEIGSEGRNFQFCHDLVLFDLPRNPDLLEQRIGRLDRIGQRKPVALHVPFFSGSAQALLLHLHAGIFGICTAPNPVAAPVLARLAPQLDQALQQPAVEPEQLWEKAASLNATMLAQHANGRDRLLELNSCRPSLATGIVTAIRQLEAHEHPGALLQAIFSNYGIDFEINTNGTWNARPGTELLVSSFPQIPDEGLTFVLDRTLALQRDDLPFVTWLHPLVLQGIDLVLQDDRGRCVAGLLQDKRLPGGTLVLEALFRATVSAGRRLQAARWFPATTVRAVVDTGKRDLGKALPAEYLDRKLQTLDKATQSRLLHERRSGFAPLLRLARQVATSQLGALIETRTAAMCQQLDAETARLLALQAVNPQVRDEEIDWLRQQRMQLVGVCAGASLQLEALRLVVVG